MKQLFGNWWLAFSPCFSLLLFCGKNLAKFWVQIFHLHLLTSHKLVAISTDTVLYPPWREMKSKTQQEYPCHIGVGPQCLELLTNESQNKVQDACMLLQGVNTCFLTQLFDLQTTWNQCTNLKKVLQGRTQNMMWIVCWHCGYDGMYLHLHQGGMEKQFPVFVFQGHFYYPS